MEEADGNIKGDEEAGNALEEREIKGRAEEQSRARAAVDGDGRGAVMGRLGRRQTCPCEGAAVSERERATTSVDSRGLWTRTAVGQDSCGQGRLWAVSAEPVLGERLISKSIYQCGYTKRQHDWQPGGITYPWLRTNTRN